MIGFVWTQTFCKHPQGSLAQFLLYPVRVVTRNHYVDSWWNWSGFSTPLRARTTPYLPMAIWTIWKVDFCSCLVLCPPFWTCLKQFQKRHFKLSLLLQFCHLYSKLSAKKNTNLQSVGSCFEGSCGVALLGAQKRWSERAFRPVAARIRSSWPRLRWGWPRAEMIGRNLLMFNVCIIRLLCHFLLPSCWFFLDTSWDTSC